MIKKYNSFLTEEITFKYHDKLNPLFWNDFEFDESVRKKLLNIALEFYRDIEIDLEVKDVQLTGSLANYNYTKFSDLDVHILVDYTGIENEELLKRIFLYEKFIWGTKHDIKIRGFNVELYVQDINQTHASSGVFSLLNNEWIIKPSIKDIKIDPIKIELKTDDFKYKIKRYSDLITDTLSPDKYKEYLETLRTLKNKIYEFRTIGLSKEEQEFSLENLVFKELRNSGYLDKLSKLINLCYDKIYIQ